MTWQIISLGVEVLNMCPFSIVFYSFWPFWRSTVLDEDCVAFIFRLVVSSWMLKRRFFSFRLCRCKSVKEIACTWRAQWNVISYLELSLDVCLHFYGLMKWFCFRSLLFIIIIFILILVLGGGGVPRQDHWLWGIWWEETKYCLKLLVLWF